MAITMRERFFVRAPIDEVWAFLLDPHCVASCMPGAHLEKIESDRSFLGRIKLAVGPFSTSYKGRVEFTELDEVLHTAWLTAEGHESGGGLAKGSMVSTLLTVDEGTEVLVDVSVDGASKLVHLGLGLSKDLAEELFAEFVDRIKGRLEAESVAEIPEETDRDNPPVQIFTLLAKGLVRRFRSNKQ